MKGSAIFCSVSLLSISAAFADGDVILDVGSNSDTSHAFTADSNGRFFVTANGDGAWLIAIEADGSPVAGFGTNSRTPLLTPGPIAIRPDGSLIAGRDSIETYSSIGLRLSAVSSCGEANCPSLRLPASSYLSQPNGNTYGGGGHVTGTRSTSWMIKRITPAGMLDPAFAGGTGWTLKDAGASRQITDMRSLPNGQFLAIGTEVISGASALGRFNADGGTDFTFGTNGFVPLTPGQFRVNVPLAIDQGQRILVPGVTNIVQRRNADGSPDGTYAEVPADSTISYADLAIDSMDRVLVFGTQDARIYVARLLPGGGLDPGFGVGGETFLTPAGAADAQIFFVSDALVDASNQPVVLFSFRTVHGNSEIGLVRLTDDGDVDPAFGIGVVDADAYPDAFTFPGNTAPFGTAIVVSDAVTPVGFTMRTTVQFAGTGLNSAFSVGCTGTFVTSPATIEPGQSICLRHSAPATAGGTTTTSISIGGRIGSFTTTASATPADMIPDAFSFSDQTGVPRSTLVESNTVTITGLNGITPISVDFGQYSIGCIPNQFRSTSSAITNGQSVCVRLTSSANFGTGASVTLAIGGVTDTFTVATLAADTTPDAFSFAGLTGTQNSVNAVSGAATMTGINTAAPITVVGGEYSLGCTGTFTATAGTIDPAQPVCLRHTTASQSNTTVTTTLTVGGISGTFSSTTAAAPAPPSGGGGGSFAWRDLAWLVLILLAARLAAPRVRLRDATT
jgi:uncharacterized delta-60 repeat protein